MTWEIVRLLPVPRDDRYGLSYRSRSTSSRRSCQSTSSWRRSRGAKRGSGSGSLCTAVVPLFLHSTLFHCCIRAMQCCGSGSVRPICFFWASRIRIHLGRYTDPDPSISSSKNSKKNIDPTVVWLLYDFLSLKNVNVPSKSSTLDDVLKVTEENSRIWIRILH
jgi:hypothetical protein